ncbi:gamma carbonic anhydrase family protein [Fastidiosibacter lacustris]|uniref:gamma carbonic anhydrase family protein n=1 Tax=Fastidiosibacter lacustris TaxID=2056695 RepID=UPI000E3413F2|nr:gamma carbonic anhydrase family protein [Fastidiosibacter lacustris]
MPIRSFNEITPKIDNSAFIDPMATVTGDVIIGKHSSIWTNVSIRGDLLNITIGNKSNVQDNSSIHTTQFFDRPGCGFDVKIGDEVTIGHGAIIHGCHIGNQVLIGMGAIILDGAIIEDEVIIGAGAVVSPGKKLESGFLYIGAPARQVRPLKESEKQYIRANAQNYCEIMQQHKKGLNQ